MNYMQFQVIQWVMGPSAGVILIRKLYFDKIKHRFLRISKFGGPVQTPSSGTFTEKTVAGMIRGAR